MQNKYTTMMATNVSTLANIWMCLSKLQRNPDPELADFDSRAIQENRTRCFEVFYRMKHLLAAMSLSYNEMIAFLEHFEGPSSLSTQTAGSNKNKPSEHYSIMIEELKKPLTTTASTVDDVEFLVYVLTNKQRILDGLKLCLDTVDKVRELLNSFEDKTSSMEFVIWAKGCNALVVAAGGLDEYFENQLDRLA